MNYFTLFTENRACATIYSEVLVGEGAQGNMACIINSITYFSRIFQFSHIYKYHHICSEIIFRY